MVEGSTSTIGKLSSQVIARHLLDGLQEEQKICETRSAAIRLAISRDLG